MPLRKPVKVNLEWQSDGTGTHRIGTEHASAIVRPLRGKWQWAVSTGPYFDFNTEIDSGMESSSGLAKSKAEKVLKNAIGS